MKTNNKTILRNSKFLELIGLINIDVKKTNQNYYYLKIRPEGLKIYNKKKEKIDEILRND